MSWTLRFFFSVLGFELRAFCLLGRFSTSSGHPKVLFYYYYFFSRCSERVSGLLARHSLRFFWQYWGLNSGQHLSHSTSPVLCWVFWDRVSRTICPCWPRTVILRISGSSHDYRLTWAKSTELYFKNLWPFQLLLLSSFFNRKTKIMLRYVKISRSTV
jgi:hypothetical protein